MDTIIEQLTVQDFLISGWEQVIADAGAHDCAFYSSKFGSTAREAKNAGDEKLGALFGLLRDLTSMMLQPDDHAQPFGPLAQLSDGRTAIVSDFSEAELTYLAEIETHATDPELKARIADVLWLRKRDYRAAVRAVAAYLSASAPLEGEHWPNAATRIERASDLAVQLKNRPLLDDVVQHIEAILSRPDVSAADPPSFFFARLMKLLQERRAGDSSHYGALAEAMAARAEVASEWHKAREFWDTAVRWHLQANDDVKALAARLSSAETFVEEAREATERETPSYMVAAHWLESAIHAMVKVGRQQERVDELHRLLLDYQKKSMSEMGVISHPFDPTDLMASAVAQVKGKGLYEALFSLAMIGKPSNVANLEKQAQAHRQEFVFSHLFGRNFKNEMGRTIARSEGASPGDEDESDVRVEMYRLAAIGRAIVAQAGIEPAREQINLEHDVRIVDFLRLVAHNPLVPEGREMAFARGLYAGMHGDFVVAVHLLIPQIENSMRHLLAQSGVISSGLDDNGIQDESDLNRTLRLPQFKGPLTTALGEDMMFELRGLLIERFGANLRNDMAHGLLRDEAFQSYPCVYLWWLTLHLLCIPVMNALTHQQTEEVSGGTDAQSEAGPTASVGSASGMVDDNGSEALQVNPSP